MATEKNHVVAVDGAADGAALPTVSEFYAGKSIFITGCTGFIGKSVLEKLLRDCSDLKTCYVLCRDGSKWNNQTKQKEPRSASLRIDDLLEEQLFNRMKLSNKKWKTQIKVVRGDITEEMLGLSEEDQKDIFANVSIIIHIAATVKFNEKMKVALRLNIYGVQQVLAVGKKLDKCDAFIHTSTAYSHTYKQAIAEEFYDATTDLDKLNKLLELLTDEQVEAMTPETIKPHPNTYTFTKCLGEALVNEHCDELPIAVVRPSIVINAWREPYKGWTDTLNGPAGMAAMAGVGFLRSVMASEEIKCALVPIDTVVNYLVVTPWNVAVRGQRGLVHNNTGTPENWVGVGQFCNNVIKNLKENPLVQVVREPSLVLFHPDKYRLGQRLHAFWDQVCHQSPVFWMDFTSWVTGGKRMKLAKAIGMATKLGDTYYPWLNTQWHWDSHRQEEIMKALSSKDRSSFNLTTRGLDWADFLKSFCEGIRPLMSNGVPPSPKDLAAAKTRLTYIRWQEYIFRTVGIAGLWRFLYYWGFVRRNLTGTRHTLLTLMLSASFFSRFREWTTRVNHLLACV